MEIRINDRTDVCYARLKCRRILVWSGDHDSSGGIGTSGAQNLRMIGLLLLVVSVAGWGTASAVQLDGERPRIGL